MKGIDYGYGKPGGKAIADWGAGFVCRYLSKSPDKNLSLDELKDLRDNNLKIVLVWETTTDRCLQGSDAGEEDAETAMNQVKALGLNGIFKTRVIYFACDDDFQGDQLNHIIDYFHGVNDYLGAEHTGVYGGLAAVKACFDAQVVKYGWQTYAWSHGEWDSRAQLRQTNIYGPKINGVSCDTDESVQDDFGQF